jgi:hypothetical protein
MLAAHFCYSEWSNRRVPLCNLHEVISGGYKEKTSDFSSTIHKIRFFSKSNGAMAKEWVGGRKGWTTYLDGAASCLPEDEFLEAVGPVLHALHGGRRGHSSIAGEGGAGSGG